MVPPRSVGVLPLAVAAAGLGVPTASAPRGAGAWAPHAVMLIQTPSTKPRTRTIMTIALAYERMANHFGPYARPFASVVERIANAPGAAEVVSGELEVPTARCAVVL